MPMIVPYRAARAFGDQGLEHPMVTRLAGLRAVDPRTNLKCNEAMSDLLIGTRVRELLVQPSLFQTFLGEELDTCGNLEAASLFISHARCVCRGGVIEAQCL